MHTDGRIGGAGSARDHAHAGTASEFAVGFGHESRAAFLAASDELNLPLTRMQAVENGQIAFTRNAKCMGYALGQKAVNKKVAGKLCGHIASLCLGIGPCQAAGHRPQAKNLPV